MQGGNFHFYNSITNNELPDFDPDSAMFRRTYKEYDDDKYYKLEVSSMKERSTMMSETTATRSGLVGDEFTLARM